jgi:hypothetical protein
MSRTTERRRDQMSDDSKPKKGPVETARYWAEFYAREAREARKRSNEVWDRSRAAESGEAREGLRYRAMQLQDQAREAEERARREKTALERAERDSRERLGYVPIGNGNVVRVYQPSGGLAYALRRGSAVPDRGRTRGSRRRRGRVPTERRLISVRPIERTPNRGRSR